MIAGLLKAGLGLTSVAVVSRSHVAMHFFCRAHFLAALVDWGAQAAELGDVVIPLQGELVRKVLFDAEIEGRGSQLCTTCSGTPACGHIDDRYNNLGSSDRQLRMGRWLALRAEKAVA